MLKPFDVANVQAAGRSLARPLDAPVLQAANARG